MGRKVIAFWLSLVMLLGMIVIIDVTIDFTLNVEGATLYVNTTGSGGAYTSIQDAINASTDGGTVFVYSGEYYENIDVNKDIHLKGESNLTTIIDGMDGEDVIIVTSAWANITGFTIQNSTTGIYMPNSNAIIENNIFGYDETYGIEMGSNNNHPIPIIRNNTFMYCDNVAIDAQYNPGGIIENNLIYVGPYEKGIRTNGDLLIIGNTIRTSGGNSHGITLRAGADVDIIENNIYSSASWGLYSCAVESQYGVGRIYNCSFDYPEPLNEFTLGIDANLTLYNTTYDSIYHYPMSSGAVVTSKWWVDVHVRDKIGNPAPGAEVWIENNTGNLEYYGITNSTGWISYIPLTERSEWTDMTINYTPHMFTASNGTETGLVLSHINQNRVIEIVLGVYGPVHNVDKDTYHFTIKKAIDNATAGNRIEVSEGIYYENVIVNKTLNLTGENIDSTIIDGGEDGTVVHMNANWTNITGFTITRGGWNTGEAGIKLESVHNCSIYNNNLSSNKLIGILLNSSKNNSVRNNIVFNNRITGITLSSSLFNDLMGNNLLSNGYEGIALSNSFDNNILNNYFESNEWGIALGGIPGSRYNNVKNNYLYNNDYGIYLYRSSNNNITHNSIFSNNLYGIHLGSSSNNNTFYYNNIVDNGFQVHLEESVGNNWNNSLGEGNYWGDYYGLDDGSNGRTANDCIGDTEIPHPFTDQGEGYYQLDNYPLMEPNPDTLPPRIQLILPSNNSIIRLGVTINLYVYDGNLDFANYSVDGGPKQILTTPFNISTQNWSSGSHTLYISAVDIYGNVVSKSYDFIIDSVPPIITLNSPANESVTTIGTKLDFSVIDTNLKHANYSVNDGDDISLNNPYNIYTSGWVDGHYKIQIKAVDVAGNMNSSWYFIIFDSTKPEIVLNSPSNKSVIPNGTYLEFTISDYNLMSVNYSINGGNNISASESFNISTTEWTDGDYTIHIHATDKVLNQNSKWYFFIVDAIPPKIVFPYNFFEKDIDNNILNITCTFTFTEPINTSNIEDYILLSIPVEFNCTWNTFGTYLIVSFHTDIPSEILDFFIIVNSNLTDINGIGLYQDYTFNFTYYPDLDNDGIPDVEDPDDDNDGVLDNEDAYPLDPNLWDDPSLDSDLDGIPDVDDPDDDNDGYNDAVEISEGTDPLDPDSKPLDNDGDLIPDSMDPDDDNDGVIDEDDFDPFDPDVTEEPSKKDEGEEGFNIAILLLILVIIVVIVVLLLLMRRKNPED